MNIPFLSCNKCTNSEDSFLITKNSLQNNKDDKIKENIYIPSDDNNKSINNLEIIEYPYSYCNQEETEIYNNNTNDNLLKSDDNNEFINVKEMLEKGLDHHIHYRNNEKNMYNNSSGVINNEDSITQNKILLKNLYDNNDNNNNDKNNNIKINVNTDINKDINKDIHNNIGSRTSRGGIKNLKMNSHERDKKKNEKSKEKRNNNNNNIIGIKVEYPCPDTDAYLDNNTKTNTNTNTNNNTHNNNNNNNNNNNKLMKTQVIKTERNSKEKKRKKTEINFNFVKISKAHLAKNKQTDIRKKNKTINKTSRRLNVKNNINISTSKNINTFSLYLNSNINVSEDLLFKSKMKKINVSKKIFSKKMSNELMRSKKSSNVNIKKKTIHKIIDNKFLNIFNKNENNTKSLINNIYRINYRVRNTVFNYPVRKNKENRVSKCYLKKTAKPDLSYAIKNSFNPFDQEESKVSRITRYIKSKSKRKQNK